MTYNRQLASLQAATGQPAEDQNDPSTVRGLLRFLRGWLNGEVTAQAIHDPCLQMASRLREAAETTFRDLDNNPDLSDEARDPILDTGESYETIAEILEELPAMASENRRKDFEEALADYENERLAVLDATEEINAQMSGHERRCPRCGHSEEGKERCPDCRLILLYPDPDGLKDYSHRSAHLSAMHLNIYSAYKAVLNGERSLETILKAIPPFAAHLADLTRFCDAQEAAEESPELVESLRADIQTGAAGIARLQAAVGSTFRSSDLNRGWEDIFESSISIQADLRRWGESEGLVEESEAVQSDDLQIGRH